MGIAYASEEIIRLIYTVKAPYNVNSLSLNLASESLKNINEFKNNLQDILSERAWLNEEFKNIKCIQKVFPTDANFFLIEFKDAENVFFKLLENEILTSKRFPQIPNCIRINVGKREENKQLINVLKTI